MKPISHTPHDAGAHAQEMTPEVQRVIDEAAKRPASPAEAEELAKKAVGDYLTACRIASPDRQAIGNYLMKLVSVAGVLMANNEGSEVAANRLAGTASFVLKTMPREPAAIVRAAAAIGQQMEGSNG